MDFCCRCVCKSTNLHDVVFAFSSFSLINAYWLNHSLKPETLAGPSKLSFWRRTRLDIPLLYNIPPTIYYIKCLFKSATTHRPLIQLKYVYNYDGSRSVLQSGLIYHNAFDVWLWTAATEWSPFNAFALGQLFETNTATLPKPQFAHEVYDRCLIE